MEQSEPPSPEGTSPFPPADLRRRALARLLDLAVALAPVWLLPRAHRHAAGLFAAALLLTGDALSGPGRSLGKRLFGLRALAVATLRPAGVRESLVRNSIFALALLPALGTLPLALAALGLACALEALVALRPLTRDLGRRRLGDLLAGTQVIDGSVALPLQQPVRLPAPSRAAPLASRAA